MRTGVYLTPGGEELMLLVKLEKDCEYFDSNGICKEYAIYFREFIKGIGPAYFTKQDARAWLKKYSYLGEL